MTARERSFERTLLTLVLVNVVTVGTIIGCLLTARRASERGESALVGLADDVTRLSQAQAAAERMVTVGRGYLLTHEPELLARAQAAEAKVVRIVHAVVARAGEGGARDRLDPLLASARRYREAFQALVSGENAPRDAPEVAAALRRHLIPAREDLVTRLDDLAAQRLQEMEARRATAHSRRGITVSFMYALGVPGIFANVLLVGLVIHRARRLIATRLVQVAPSVRPTVAGRSTPPNRLSRRSPSVRPRP